MHPYPTSDPTLHLRLVLPNASLMAINPDLVAWGEEAIAASRGHRPSAVQGCSMVSSGGEGGVTNDIMVALTSKFSILLLDP